MNSGDATRIRGYGDSLAPTLVGLPTSNEELAGFYSVHMNCFPLQMGREKYIRNADEIAITLRQNRI